MTTRQWRRATQFLEKYTSHFIWKSSKGLPKVLLWEELETEQNCNILTPTLMAISVVSFSFSRAAQSPTQYLPITGHRDVSLPLSLELHVWLTSSGNNCHALHRSLSSGASVWLYRGILPCPILSAKPAYANGICNFRVFGMACLAGSKVNIQQSLTKQVCR